MNPIVEAVSAILKVEHIEKIGRELGLFRQQGETREICIGVYSRSRDAQLLLWCLDDHGYPTQRQDAVKRLAECSRIIVIDTDGVGDLGVESLATHLAAIDWAHCICAAIAQTAGVQDLPRIDVLDLRSGAGDRDPGRTGVSYFPTVLRYHAAGTGRRAKAVDAVVTSLSGVHPVQSRLDPGDLSVGLQRWLSNLAIADSRSGSHQLNNALGPLALAVTSSQHVRDAVIDCGDPPQRLARSAMSRALEWALAGANGRDSLRPLASIDWPAIYQSTRYVPTRDLRILLLDDQANEGWIPILCHALDLDALPKAPSESPHPFLERGRQRGNAPGRPKVSLWVATDVRPVLQRVLEFPAPAQVGVARPLRLSPDSDDVDEMLLLDLRLFARLPSSNAAQRREAEREFLRTVQACLELLSQPANTLGQQVRQVDDRTPDDSPEYLSALTWFARLIAKLDFTYPVILWSSTGQRHVTESLKDLPSIYTGLAKPRFASYGLEGIEFGLIKAIETQFQMIAASAFLRNNRYSPAVTKAHACVDIYTDESGNGNDLRLGGYAVVS